MAVDRLGGWGYRHTDIYHYARARYHIVLTLTAANVMQSACAVVQRDVVMTDDDDIFIALERAPMPWRMGGRG